MYGTDSQIVFSFTAESLHSNSLSGSEKKGLLGFLKFNRRKSKVEWVFMCINLHKCYTFIVLSVSILTILYASMLQNKSKNNLTLRQQLMDMLEETNAFLKSVMNIKPLIPIPMVKHCKVFIDLMSVLAMLVLHSHFRAKISPLRTWRVLMMIVLLTMQTLTVM